MNETEMIKSDELESACECCNISQNRLICHFACIHKYCDFSAAAIIQTKRQLNAQEKRDRQPE